MAIKGFTPPEDVRSLYEEKLASSGISLAQAKDLGMSYMTAEQSAAEQLWMGHSVPALKIPYFHPLTGKPLSAGKGWKAFYRARALRMPAVPPKKFSKYIQPLRSGVCAYFPRTDTIDWKTLVRSPDYALIITEGELKAAKATLEGYPTIGLGGVFNFQSNYPDTPFLPELEEVNWVTRRVHIVYDSDIVTNKNVALAARRFTQVLVDHGAVPYLVVIPGAGKVGLDDYLLSDGCQGLDYLLEAALPLSVADHLLDMNNRYAVLMEGSREVVDMRTGGKMKDDQLTYITAKKVDERRIQLDGTIQHEPTNAAKVWLTWPLRQEARALIYDPAQPALALVENKYDSFDFNIWPGFAIQPQKGDITPFTELINHLFTGALPWIKDWLLDWLAYPLQFPGTKMFTAVVMHGLVHGSGKTLIGETMKRIYGDAYTVIGQDQLKSDFNEWASGRSFILGDDITGLDRLDIHDRLKVKISQNSMWINPKGLTAYELDDHINWFFTSNRANAFYLDEGDRRFYVWEVPKSAGKKDRAFYISYMEWLNGPGPAALFDWFLKRDVRKFDPGDAAPETFAKIKMREEARSGLANWLDDLRTRPDDLLALNSIPMVGDLFTSKQIRAAYTTQAGIRDDDPRLANQVGTGLTAAGFEQVHGRKIVTGEGVEAARYFAIRNPAKWRDASLADIQAHIRGETVKPKAKKERGKKY